MLITSDRQHPPFATVSVESNNLARGERRRKERIASRQMALPVLRNGYRIAARVRKR